MSKDDNESLFDFLSEEDEYSNYSDQRKPSFGHVVSGLIGTLISWLVVAIVIAVVVFVGLFIWFMGNDVVDQYGWEPVALVVGGCALIALIAFSFKVSMDNKIYMAVRELRKENHEKHERINRRVSRLEEQIQRISNR